ncbi:hypothetical protein [Bacteroides heparinolyticus]|uniref:hypothetical protein n=1 Tax=Prevotella heparinolytica TaxID=28113 RepID=UPI0035A17F22
MKEKLLALLNQRFLGARKDGLKVLAGILAVQATTEEEAKALVEKLTKEQVEQFIKDFRADVDKEVSEGNRTFEANLRKKFDLVEKVEPGNEPKPKDDPKPDDIATIVAQAVAGAVKPLQEELNRFKQGEVGKSRLQALQEKLAACKDETFKAQTLKDFARMSFADDNAFNEYLTEKETDIVAANQSVANAKMSGAGGAPLMAQKTENGTSQAVADYIASQKPEGNTLTGKEL